MSDIIPAVDRRFGRVESMASDDLIEIGQWYWVKTTVSYDGAWKNDDGTPLPKGAEAKWLGCIMKIGSNFVELHSPPSDRSYSTKRVHLRDFFNELDYEPDADQIIKTSVASAQQRVNHLLGKVQEVTARLGVVPQKQIAEGQGEGTNALAVISTQVDTDAYKQELIKAKDETLPELFKQVEEAHRNLAKWMMAPTLPTKALIGPMKDSVGAVEDRIYTISLYAGLTEDAVLCSDGEPAALTEKLRVMQRRLYMDEECIANYTAGGITIQEIDQFDEWVSLPENRDRLLPFPRTVAAFRVRRESKEREDGGNVLKMFVNLNLREADKFTYLYIRNGEQVWRIVCDFEFDEMIFPDTTIFDPTSPMMFKTFGSRVDKLMPRSEWEQGMADKAAKDRLNDLWVANHPKEDAWRSPFRYSDHRDLNEYQPLDDTSVYYDEAMAFLAAEVKRYNRVAVIIQGLFDRSMVLHPHPPVQVWTPSGFQSAIELVYDATTLTYGDKPDFEAYRARLNATLGLNSVVTGQRDSWLKAMAARENEKQARDWRSDRTRSNWTRYQPYGNPGPALVGTMDEWKPRAKAAVFRWMKGGHRYYSEQRPTSYTAPSDDLLNVSAYQPGDFKQFFADPRTRREYLKWAPMLLAAEDYHAGIHREQADSSEWG